MKGMINQDKNLLKSITNRLDCKEYINSVLEDRTSGIEDRLYVLEDTEGTIGKNFRT